MKQFAKFIRTSNVSQVLSKSEFIKNIPLMQQQRKAWNESVNLVCLFIKERCKLGIIANREKLEIKV